MIDDCESNDKYLDQAVDILGPFASTEERASDREQMIQFAATFREYCDAAEHAITFSAMREKFDTIARKATDQLVRLN